MTTIFPNNTNPISFSDIIEVMQSLPQSHPRRQEILNLFSRINTLNPQEEILEEIVNLLNYNDNQQNLLGDQGFNNDNNDNQ